MSAHYHEFNLSNQELLYPVPMTERIQILDRQIIFQFADAILSVQGTDERLASIILELHQKGYVELAMPAQLVDRNTNPDL